MAATSNTLSTTTPAYTEAWLPGPDGLQFYTRTYRPPAGTPACAALLFVHGFAEHVARYEWAHGVWAARGVAVFAYDQRGFGRTALDKERKSRESAWGRTGWREQVRDIEWWLGRMREEFPGLPLFLMGHSMGGGLALAFATRPSPPPAPESVQMLAGVIASSPLLLQTHPAPKILRYIGGKASSLLPHLLIDAPVPVEHLSHDPQAQKAAANDPLMLQKGSLRGLSDMLGGGEQLLWNDYKNWPQNLPLLIVHGTADRVTSYKASEEFYNKVDAADKELKPYPVRA
ncbi:lysophospholipase [Trametes coccinea BRFM310]|uniref:Lysophospholipase n=1 Tax=Trametes coccinea (strain BRFM310) TaxID=1353009 RepID=A0A1Y2I865_TRAC3|nr:lysophospholipase [Trametes coccinea BRFM310]